MDKFPEYLRVAIKLAMIDRDRFYDTFQLWAVEPRSDKKIALSCHESSLLAEVIADSDLMQAKKRMTPELSHDEMEANLKANEPFFPELRKDRKGMKEERDVIKPGKELNPSRIITIIREFKKFNVSKIDLLDYLSLDGESDITEKHMGLMVKMLSILKKGVLWGQLIDILPDNNDEQKNVSREEDY